jgi:tetratricopeptide (TPR) repeat protein
VITLPSRYSDEMELLGQGGFATVYRTRDLVLDREVAIKVPFRGGGEDLVREVTTELQATAAVRHPNIIQVLDVGTSASGDPFLVLEYAPEGSLASLRAERDLDWVEMEPLLRGILAGLGHAHAHGLVHRDIKPANILLDRDDGQLRARISDLGLAKVLDRHGDYRSTRLMAGTILYMAPEQFEEDLAAVHPGVDLYAFGVLMYQLVTGRAPWEGGSDLALLFNRANRQLRPFVPRMHSGSPPGLGAVVERLLAPEPADRYPLAADVLAAIAALPGPVGQGEPPIGSDSMDTRLHPGAHPIRAVRLPAVPPTAASPERLPPTPVVAAVRTPLLVGRADERGALWETVRRACSSPVGLAVVGAPGTGRSRLCGWLTGVLEEAGFARTLRVRLEGHTSPNEGLRGALRHHLALGRLHGDRLASRLVAVVERSPDLGPVDVGLLRGFLDPAEASSTAGPVARPGHAARSALLDRLLLAESRRGLVCLWVQEALEVGAAQLVAEAMAACQARGTAALLLYEPPVGQASLPPGLACFETLEVGPLPDGEMRRLVEDMLPAGGDLEVEEVVRRAAGNPAIAVEWTRLDGLRLSSASHPRLAAQAPPAWLTAVADVDRAEDAGTLGTVSVATLVVTRLATFFAASTEEQGARRLLSLLVLLPRPVSRSALEALFVATGDGGMFGLLLDEIQAAGLVRSDAGGRLDLVTPQLTEALVELACDRPDIADLRLASATLLLTSSETRSVGRDVHAARLLLEAGDFERALEIATAVGEAMLAHDLTLALTALDVARQAAAALALPVADPRHFEALLATGRALRNSGQLDEVGRLLEPVELALLPPRQRGWLLQLSGSVEALRGDLPAGLAAAEAARALFAEAGDRVGLARATQLAAEVAFREGSAQEALAGFERGLRLARDAGSAVDELGCLWRLARLRRGAGQTSVARVEFEEALRQAESLGDLRVQAIVRRELGNLALAEGRLDRAEQLLGTSAELLERGGFPTEAATTRLSVGEVARARGHLREARDAYSTALAAAIAYDLAGTALVALVDLAIVELEMGRSGRASRRLDSLDERLPPGTPHRYRPYVEAIRLAVTAANGDWGTAEAVLETLEDSGPPADPDLLALVEGAGTSAAAAGEATLAMDCWQLTLDLADRCHDAVATARLRGKLAGLGG